MTKNKNTVNTIPATSTIPTEGSRDPRFDSCSPPIPASHTTDFHMNPYFQDLSPIQPGTRNYPNDKHEIGLFIASWSPAPNRVVIQTNDVQFIRELVKLDGCKAIALDRPTGFWKAFEFPKSLDWAQAVKNIYESSAKLADGSDLKPQAPPSSRMTPGVALTPESVSRGSKPGSTRNIRAMGGRLPVKRVKNCASRNEVVG